MHALLGENGAGKSTLLHIGYGMLSPDAGTIRLRGQPVKLGSPRDARAHRIGMVHQHFTSIEALTVRENLELAIGRRLDRNFDWARGFLTGLRPDDRVERLSVALRQRLEIAKALALGAEILLLDEPSALLAPSEVDALLGLVGDFVKRGGAAAFVTHKLPEVFTAADRVTVLRQGQVALRGSVSELTPGALAAAMIGEPPRGPGPADPGHAPHTAERAVVRIGEIAIRPGELVGVAAIEGQGHRDLLRRIAGLPVEALEQPAHLGLDRRDHVLGHGQQARRRVGVARRGGEKGLEFVDRRLLRGRSGVRQRVPDPTPRR